MSAKCGNVKNRVSLNRWSTWRVSRNIWSGYSQEYNIVERSKFYGRPHFLCLYFRKAMMDFFGRTVPDELSFSIEALALSGSLGNSKDSRAEGSDRKGLKVGSLGHNISSWRWWYIMADIVYVFIMNKLSWRGFNTNSERSKWFIKSL